ncbi:hypothetical protein NZ47_11450 [Anaerovibrio lipolyticus]|uniref:Uncharacterized protein n=1 Tax=Anaerovibrio lipolyticus TaxID=82374 RepID=A0A0B2JSI3_9FIRM|nr:hypothetical protein [Anaerovibrio lipolyticus]KHM51270.1 hypothetical protein NZ47_11450 [Anaerovibrio lipolyticus]
MTIKDTFTQGLTADWYKQAVEMAIASRDNVEISDIHTLYALQFGTLLDIPCAVTLQTIKGGEDN